MHLISIPKMQRVVEQVVVGQNEPCWFHGEPGCGKSQGIQQACDNLGAQLIDFRLGQYDTIDFKGFPGVADDGTTVWHMASTLPFVGNKRFDPERKKIIFFDEADHGKESVKGVCYQLMQERRVGEHVLMPNTFICSAGNRRQDRGIGGKDVKPLNNRNTHYEVGPDADAWIQWAVGQDRIPPEYIAFLTFRKPLISNFDPTSPEPAFATPRTHEKAAHYLAEIADEDIRDASIEGAIGEAASIELSGFLKLIEDMPSLANIERNPLGVEVSPRPEVRWAVACGIGGEMAKRPDAVTPFHQYLNRMDPEFVVLGWQLAVKRNEQVMGSKEFIEISRVHQATFQAANAR